MAARKGGELVYVGEVGTAFSRPMSRALRKLLEGIVAKKPTVNLKRNNAIFTVPLLFAEVEFRACRCHRHANKAGRAKAPLSATLSLQGTGSVRRAAPARYCMFRIGKDAPG